jgi:hypothetical protein
MSTQILVVDDEPDLKGAFSAKISCIERALRSGPWSSWLKTSASFPRETKSVSDSQRSKSLAGRDWRQTSSSESGGSSRPGTSIRKTAEECGVNPSTVQRIKHPFETSAVA